MTPNKYTDPTYTDLKKEYEKTKKQIESLRRVLIAYPRTKIEGSFTSKDAQSAATCIDNIRVQMGILEMIAL